MIVKLQQSIMVAHVRVIESQYIRKTMMCWWENSDVMNLIDKGITVWIERNYKKQENIIIWNINKK